MVIWALGRNGSWGTNGRYNGKAACFPVYELGTESIKVPALFAATKGREFNTVTHAKFIAPKNCPVLPSTTGSGYLFPQINIPIFRKDCQYDLGSAAYTCWIASDRFTLAINFAGYNHNGYNSNKFDTHWTIYKAAPAGVRPHGYRDFGVGLSYGQVSFWSSSGEAPPNFSSYAISISRKYAAAIRSASPFDPTDMMWEVYEVVDRMIDRWSPRAGLAMTRYSAEVFEAPSVEALQSGYLLGEQALISGEVPYKPGLSEYWLNSARQHAFLDACESMPRLSDNSISNLSEIFEFLLSVIRREPPKLKGDLGSAWLAYRYQYSTTKMDINEAISFIDRYCDLGSLSAEITTRGIHRFQLQGSEVTCRCRLKVVPRQILTLRNILSDLRTAWYAASVMGLAPDLYYLWDSTPFSFIVDWFIPVGDVLAVQDASFLYTGANYDFKTIEYSLSYEREISGYLYRYYSRWYENTPPSLNGFYWLEPQEATGRQLLFRSLDAASLFLGGIHT